MLISEKILTKVFEGANYKDAYLKSCKYISKNLINNKEISNITYKVEKIDDSNIQLTIYSYIEESTIFKQYCSNCKEFNNLFYIKHRVDCSKCDIKNYKGRIKERMQINNKFIKSRLK